MKKIFGWMIICHLFFSFQTLAAVVTPLKPFPQHTVYVTNSIKPTNATQAQMDNEVKKQWDLWKKNHLKPAGPNRYYVKYNSKGETVSEAHGYGMLLTAFMAGSDPDAQVYFDGLYRYYTDHPSKITPYLMASKQNSQFEDIDGADSATDGDLDIAYALLLADKQWGSQGSIPYFQAAIHIINAIMKGDVSKTNLLLNLGDWSPTASIPAHVTGTRPSDFMLGHLRAFAKATHDSQWETIITNLYSVINNLYRKSSPHTGLLPDFAVKNHQDYVPAYPEFLEGPNDGNYSYNACRTPWRIATDYLMNKETAALDQLNTLNRWIQDKTHHDPKKIKAGYLLDGSPLPHANFSSAAFFAPLGVSAMINTENQGWLNTIWKLIVDSEPEGYYEDSIKLLSTIVISGNWWQP